MAYLPQYNRGSEILVKILTPQDRLKLQQSGIIKGTQGIENIGGSEYYKVPNRAALQTLAKGRFIDTKAARTPLAVAPAPTTPISPISKTPITTTPTPISPSTPAAPAPLKPAPTPFTLPTGYEKISGAKYTTTEAQRGAYDDIRTDPTGTFLYGKAKLPATASAAPAPTATTPTSSLTETPATGQTGVSGAPPVNPPAPIDTSKSVSDFSTEQNKQTADMFASLQKSMTDSQTALQKQQQDFMTKFGETANKELLTKFEETQTSQKEAMKAYYDQQTQFLEDLKNQPSAVDQLKTFRDQQGMPQMEAEIAKMDQAVLDVEGLLTNLEADIKKRTEGLPVTEAASRRLQAMEGAPLEKRLNELIRSRQRVAAGYEQKQAAVQDFASSAERDIARKREASGFGLQFAKEKAEFGGDIATQSFNMFSNLQDRLLKVGEAGLGFAQSSAEFSQNLAKAGFDMFSQMQSKQLTGYTADKENELAKLNAKASLSEKETQRQFELEKQANSFKNDLILKQAENEMKLANPDYDFKTVEDEIGNVTMIQTDKKTGKSTMTNLGNIGKGFKKTDGEGGTIPSTNIPEFSNEEKKQIIAFGLNEFSPELQNKAINGKYNTDDIRDFAAQFKKSQAETPSQYLDTPEDEMNYFNEFMKWKADAKKPTKFSAAEIEAGVTETDTTEMRNKKVAIKIKESQKDNLKLAITNWKKEKPFSKDDFLSLTKESTEFNLLTDTEIDQIFNELNPKKDSWWNPFD